MNTPEHEVTGREAAADPHAKDLLAELDRRAQLKRAGDVTVPRPVVDDLWQHNFPCVVAVLNWRGMDGKYVKDAARLSLEVGDGVVVATISDPVLRASASCEARDFTAAIAKLDRLLANSPDAWHQWRSRGKSAITYTSEDKKPCRGTP